MPLLFYMIWQDVICMTDRICVITEGDKERKWEKQMERELTGWIFPKE